MRKTSWAAVVVLAGVALSLMPAAQAGEPTVEGDSYHAILTGGSVTGTLEIAWGCSAKARGARFIGTGVDCTLLQWDAQAEAYAVIDSFGQAESGNTVVTTPRHASLAVGGFRICWEAQGFRPDWTVVRDMTQPNCDDIG